MALIRVLFPVAVPGNQRTGTSQQLTVRVTSVDINDADFACETDKNFRGVV